MSLKPYGNLTKRDCTTLISVWSYINLLKLNIRCQRLGVEHWFAVACVSEARPRSQWSELLRRSIIDDEIWQAVEPYGPFFLLQLLVFPQLICADQVVCVCLCVFMPASVCHWLCPRVLHQQLSIFQYVRRDGRFNLQTVSSLEF